MNQPLRLLLALPILTFVSACERNAIAPDVSPFATELPSTPALQQFVPPRSIRDHYTILSRQYPGFTGVFLDDVGQFTIVATRKLPLIAEEAITRWAADYTRAVSAGEVPRYKLVEFDYQTLDDNFRQIVERLSPSLGISSTAIDEVAGRVRIGLVDIGKEGALRNAISGLQIPGRVLEVVEQPLPSTRQTLHSVRRPLIGGLAVQTGNMGPGDYCTIGFIAFKNTFGNPDPSLGKFFTTASHCDVPGPISGISAGQPTNAPSNIVGYEVDDAPIFFSCPGVPGYCQWADVMVVQVNPSVTAAFGNVAKTWQPTQTFPFTIQGLYNIQSIPEGAIVGMWVRKIGAQTGETWGKVLASCENWASQSNPSHYIMCNQRGSKDFKHGGGDSGGPVFQHSGEGNGPLTVGTMWAGFTSGAYSGQILWSPMSHVGSALGGNYTFH